MAADSPCFFVYFELRNSGSSLKRKELGVVCVEISFCHDGHRVFLSCCSLFISCLCTVLRIRVSFWYSLTIHGKYYFTVTMI
jgi:hypothetical protein